MRAFHAVFVICSSLFFFTCTQRNEMKEKVESYSDYLGISIIEGGILILSEKYCSPCQKSALQRMIALDCKETILVVNGVTLSSEMEEFISKIKVSGFRVILDKKNYGERIGLPLGKPFYIQVEKEKIVTASNYENALDIPFSCD